MNSVVYSRLGDILKRALEQPVGRVEPAGERRARVSLSVGRAHHDLELIWVGRGWPAETRRQLAALPSPWPRQLIAVAEQFSVGAKDVMHELDANWLDETGAADIRTGSGLLILRDAQRDPAAPAKASPLRWGASAIDAVEVLLSGRPDVFRASELATRTGWSHAQMTKLLRQLAAGGWVAKAGTERGQGSGWRIADYDGLLRAWSEHAAGAGRTKVVLAHRTMRDSMSFLHSTLGPKLSAQANWAVSGWAGLDLAAPFVSGVPVLHVYVAEDAIDDGRLRDVLRATGLREVDEGARVEFRPLSNVGLSLARPYNTTPVVSAPRLFADLHALGGRGDEAAEHVREELIGV